MIYNILKETAEKSQGAIAVCQNDKNITYLSLLNSVNKISSHLNGYLNNKKSNVLMLFDNSVEFIKLFFALNLSGAVVIPVYYNTPINKLIMLTQYYDVELLITTKEKTDNFNQSDFNNCNCLSNILYIENDSINIWFKKEARELCFEEKDNDLALILLSSGTTGMPKGILLSNKNVESNVKSISDYLKLNEDDKILLIKNIHHVSSIIGEMLVSIYNGCIFYITNKLITPALILKMTEQYKITVLFAVPALLSALVSYKKLDKYDMSSLRIINFYGAPAEKTLIEKLFEKFKNTNLIYSYGQTEASPRVTYIEGSDLKKRKTSCGRAVKDVEIFIKGSRKSFSKGEVLVRGPNVMLGIYKNKKLTKERLKDGYLHTNDSGYMDNEGFLYILGRIDNMIIQAGKNIYPEEIEKVILSFNGVEEALVKGEKDKILGQKIIAYIVVENMFFNLKILKTYLKNNLEDYKIPREIYIVEKLKKTASGKIMRGVIYNE